MAPVISVEKNSESSEIGNRLSILAQEALRGRRLVLKPPTAEDDGPLCTIFSDIITVKYLPHFHRQNGWTIQEVSERRLQQEEEFLQGIRLSYTIHVIEKTAQGDEVSTVAGITGYRLNGDGTAEFGIILHHPFWRKGFYTEAAYVCLKYGYESLAMKRVDWFTRKDNKPMRRWCESLGMEAYEKLGLEIMGESVGYSLLETEWHGMVCHILEQRLSWTDEQLT